MEDFLTRYETLKKAHQDETLKLMTAHQKVARYDLEMQPSPQSSPEQFNYYSLKGMQQFKGEQHLTQHQASYLSSALALEETHRNALLALSNEVAEYQIALRQMQTDLIQVLAGSESKITNLKNEADGIARKATTLSHSIREIGDNSHYVKSN